MNSSIFLHQVASPGGRRAVFNALTLQISEPPQDSMPFDPEELLGKYRDFCVSAGVTMATFFVTGRCPRRCGYCFVPASMGTMTPAEVDEGLRMFSSVAPGPADILIYGGEPLLEPELVMRIAGKARSEHNLCLATGGWNVPGELAGLLAERDCFVIISIDGAEGVHNTLRPLPGGSSHKLALDTFHAFRSAGCRVGISVTVTRGNAHRVREDFSLLMDTLKPDDMGLNLWMHPKPGESANPFEAPWREVFNAVTGCLSDALRKGMYVEQLFRRLRPLATSSPRLRDCPSRGGRLVFAPGGTVSPCDCMAAAGLHCARSIEELLPLLEGFSRLVPVFREECLSCPCIALCGGGCLYDVLSSTGSLGAARSERCEFERALLEWILGEMLDSLPPDRAPGTLTVEELRGFLPAGVLARERMPQPEGMLGGELNG